MKMKKKYLYVLLVLGILWTIFVCVVNVVAHADEPDYWVYLPVAVKKYQTDVIYIPPPTPVPPTPTPAPETHIELIGNGTGATLCYEVYDTGIGLKCYTPGEHYYGSFPAGRYSWKVSAKCGTLHGDTWFRPGTWVARFLCGRTPLNQEYSK